MYIRFDNSNSFLPCTALLFSMVTDVIFPSYICALFYHYFMALQIQQKVNLIVTLEIFFPLYLVIFASIAHLHIN